MPPGPTPASASCSRSLRFDQLHGTWVILNRFRPGVLLQTHRHTGSVDAYTSAGRWHYLEYDFYVTAGSYLFEPANSVHTLHVPEDNTEDTDVCFVIEGALLNLARRRLGRVGDRRPGHARGLLRTARGPGRSAPQRPHRLSPSGARLGRRRQPPHRPAAVPGRRSLRPLRRTARRAPPWPGTTPTSGAGGFWAVTHAPRGVGHRHRSRGVLLVAGHPGRRDRHHLRLAADHDAHRPAAAHPLPAAGAARLQAVDGAADGGRRDGQGAGADRSAARRARRSTSCRRSPSRSRSRSSASCSASTASQWPRFYEWSEAVIPGESERSAEERAALQVEMWEYLIGVAEQRRAGAGRRPGLRAGHRSECRAATNSARPSWPCS